MVIVGGGFGGLYAAKKLRRRGVLITLIDKRNFHLFQPLLYQVATGELSAGDIASPLRAIFKNDENIRVINSEVIDIEPREQKVFLRNSEIDYDILIVASGVEQNYYGKESQWRAAAPSLKTVEDALEIRGRILSAFENAEKENNPEIKKSWLTFLIIGGGPTGVEMAGALVELAFQTLQKEFRTFNAEDIRIILVEKGERILTAFSLELSQKAEQELKRRGVEIRKNTSLSAVEDGVVCLESAGELSQIASRTLIWAAGIKGAGMSEILRMRTAGKLDHNGRVMVNPDLSLPGYRNIFVIGDLANFSYQDGHPLPAIAPVAVQQGKYVAGLIQKKLSDRTAPPFRYRDKGILAVIGRNAAIANFGRLKLSGFFAWLLWIFVHIAYLIEFDNKFIVLFQWAWNYFTHRRHSRLIIGKFACLSETCGDVSQPSNIRKVKTVFQSDSSI
ncbi:MAG: NAD(P)/FAD-dependent oxidoreductase [Calditrichia bacterium]